MKKVFMMCVIACMSAYAYGQAITILDDVTGQPVELAIVISDKHKTGEMTNHEGQLSSSLFKMEPVILRYTFKSIDDLYP